MTPQTELPWGARRERAGFPSEVPINTNTKPGEFILQTLFAEFAILSEKKIELVIRVNFVNIFPFVIPYSVIGEILGLLWGC